MKPVILAALFAFCFYQGSFLEICRTVAVQPYTTRRLATPTIPIIPIRRGLTYFDILGLPRLQSQHLEYSALSPLYIPSDFLVIPP